MYGRVFFQNQVPFVDLNWYGKPEDVCCMSARTMNIVTFLPATVVSCLYFISSFASLGDDTQ